MDHAEACEVLRQQVGANLRQYVQASWLALGFAAVIGLVAWGGAMPMTEALIAWGVLGTLALGLWMRGTGRLGADPRTELEQCIQEPSLLTGYDSKKVDDGHDASGEADLHTGGPVIWRIRFHRVEDGKLSVRMTQNEKKRFLQAVRTVFPDLKRRSARKK